MRHSCWYGALVASALLYGCAFGAWHEKEFNPDPRTPLTALESEDGGPGDGGVETSDAEAPGLPDAMGRDAEPEACIPSPESCNGLDDDCDALADEGASDCGAGCERLERAGRSYLVCATPRSWPGAQRSCANVGYTLASAQDAGEDNWFYRLISVRGFEGTWLGLNDLVSEGSWIWDDRSPLIYENWDEGEPNDAGGEDCGIVMTSPGRASYWDDRACVSERPYICEQLAAP